MPKALPQSSKDPKPNPYIGKSINKSLLTPCRQIGLSRKRKTPNSLNKSAGSTLDVDTSNVSMSNVSLSEDSKERTIGEVIAKPSQKPTPKESKRCLNKRKATPSNKSNVKIIPNEDKDETPDKVDSDINDVLEIEPMTSVTNQAVVNSKRNVARCLPMKKAREKGKEDHDDDVALEHLEKAVEDIIKPHSINENMKRQGRHSRINKREIQTETKSPKQHPVQCLDNKDEDFCPKSKPLPKSKINSAKKRVKRLALDDDFAPNLGIGKPISIEGLESGKSETNEKSSSDSLNKGTDSEPSSQEVKPSRTNLAKRKLKRVLSDDDDFVPEENKSKNDNNLPEKNKHVSHHLKKQKSIDSQSSSQEDKVSSMKLLKPTKTYKRSLSLKKSSSNNYVDESPTSPPFKGFSTPIKQCSITLTPLQMSPDVAGSVKLENVINEDEDFIVKLKKVEVLQSEVEKKRQLLETLKQAEIYQKMHNIADINRTTVIWKEGCKRALNDLLSNLKSHGDMNMTTLLNNLKVPPNLISCNSEEELQ